MRQLNGRSPCVRLRLRQQKSWWWHSFIKKYLPVRRDGDSATQLPDYWGPPRPELDEDISVAEVRQAIFALNRKSAPGPDGVTNRMLRNLDDPSIVFLTDKINEAWKSGVVPAEWTTAWTVLIPKPGKAPNIENSRLISLTSCIGNVMERVVLNRLNGYLEDTEVYTYNMIDFLAGLSTQDAMKLIKRQIVDGRSRDVKALLGLYLEKAFDNVLHTFIVKTISDLGLGSRLHSYVNSFLTDRLPLRKCAPRRTGHSSGRRNLPHTV